MPYLNRQTRNYLIGKIGVPRIAFSPIYFPRLHALSIISTTTIFFATILATPFSNPDSSSFAGFLLQLLPAQVQANTMVEDKRATNLRRNHQER